MLIANKLVKDNIAEYLLYMWQVEDIIRANNLDIERLQQSYLSRFELDEMQQVAVKGWYESLIEMMKSEGCAEQGHLQINKNIIIYLSDIHAQLIKSPKHSMYSAMYYKVLPYIVELRKRAKEQKNEIETCFEALYCIMMLRLQKKEISNQTQAAIEQITQLIACLAEYYKQDKQGELEL